MILVILFLILGTWIIAKSIYESEPFWLLWFFALMIVLPMADVALDEIDSSNFERSNPVVIDESKRLYEAEMNGEICTARKMGGEDTFDESPAGQVTKFVIIKCEEK